MRITLPLLLLTACLGDDDSADSSPSDTGTLPAPQLLENVGSACLSETEPTNGIAGPTLDLASDQSAWVLVTLGERGGCDTVVSESCSVTVDGGSISIDASAELQDAPPTVTCTSAAFAIQVWCETDALSAGSYTMSYAGESVGFDLPYSGEVICTMGN